MLEVGTVCDGDAVSVGELTWGDGDELGSLVGVGALVTLGVGDWLGVVMVDVGTNGVGEFAPMVGEGVPLGVGEELLLGVPERMLKLIGNNKIYR